MWTFGSNFHGQLGHTANINYYDGANPIPTQVMNVGPPILPPVISNAVDVTVAAAAGQCSAAAANPVTVTGDRTPTVTYNGAGWPGVFPVGTTTVAAHAVNTGGAADASLQVTVNDIQTPSINPLTDQNAVATGPAGATVTYPARIAADNCPGVSVTATPASGSVFPVGDTSVTVTATDPSTNTATATFSVHVAGAFEQLAAFNGWRWRTDGDPAASSLCAIATASCLNIPRSRRDQRSNREVDLLLMHDDGRCVPIAVKSFDDRRVRELA